MAKLLAVMEKYGICILSFRVLLHKMPPVETSEKDCMKSDQSVHLAHYISWVMGNGECLTKNIRKKLRECIEASSEYYSSL